MNNCIVSQVHIPEYDIQGGLTKEDKLEIVDASIYHLKKFNPYDYIILTGHGYRPYPQTLDNCNMVFWENECRPLNANGTVAGFPAQFYWVSQGIKHAKHLGFNKILKTRGDCLIGKPDIINECEQVLQQENKQLLITQMTDMTQPRLGDCFMYGDIDTIDKIWNYNNPVLCETDGLANTGQHFNRHFNKNNLPWIDFLKSMCSFRNVTWIQFMDLRWNFNKYFRQKWYDELKLKLYNQNFPYNDYYWGKTNSWFDLQDRKDLANINGPFFSEETFYQLV